MLTRKVWHVLIVDDEPDVHQVTELVLKREEVFGAKLALKHARSAQEAKDILTKDPAYARGLPVALVDVVMENDTAGLEFCRFVREDLNKHSMQLVLRTGQPGMAPPRKVIDDYNISGYLTKIEASGDRLYMAIKSAIQSYYETTLIEGWAQLMDSLRQSCTTAEQLVQGVQKVFQQNFGEGYSMNAAYDFFGKYYAGSGYFAEKSAYDAIRADLLKRGSPELETRRWPVAWGAAKGSGTPNPVAKVDDFIIVQTRVTGSDKLATLIFKDPTYPRGTYPFYGGLWRQHLALLAETVARLS